MKIKLQEILDNRNISVYSLSKEIGVTGNNLGKLVKGETTSIKYDILEKLCNILNITPNDIFEIEPQLTLFNYKLTIENMSYFTIVLIICSQYSVLYSIRYIFLINFFFVCFIF